MQLLLLYIILESKFRIGTNFDNILLDICQFFEKSVGDYINYIIFAKNLPHSLYELIEITKYVVLYCLSPDFSIVFLNKSYISKIQIFKSNQIEKFRLFFLKIPVRI